MFLSNVTKWFSGRPQPSKRRPRRTSLQVENLETRELPAVVALVVTQVTTTATTPYLSIQGDAAANNIVVREGNGRLSIDGLQIRVGNTLQSSIAVNSVRFVSVRGGDGTDRIDLSAVQGMVRSGYYGDLDGGAGDDVIIGSAQADMIFGSDGNDTLLGGDGVDYLNGGAGNDGMFGGAGVNDYLYGGTGNDRFWHTHFTDTLSDRATNDVAMFLSVDSRESDSGTALGWTDREIEVLDKAAGTLQAAAGGSTKVLKNTVGSQDYHILKETTLQRNANVIGLNSVRTLNGATLRTIHMKDWNETSAAASQQAMTTFIHELFHNFDTGEEQRAAGLSGQGWTNFLNLSGWTQTRPSNMTGWAVSTDGKWYYRTNAAFSRAYSRTNPFEDFSTTAELYFDYKLRGLNPAAQRPDMAAKFQAIENLLNSLR